MTHVEAALSGKQIALIHGDYEAVVASTGASLRTLRHRGRDLVLPFEAEAVRPGFRGTVLAPWPNRIVDGRYAFDGYEQQLALNEPSRGHALHGLVAWTDFDIVDSTASKVVLTTTIAAQQGYPHPVRVDVTYSLGDHGLETLIEGTNLGKVPAPWGSSAHPYLVAGPGTVDDWTLTVPSDTVLETSGDRLLPAGPLPVAEARGGSLDFRSPRVIGDTFVDHAYTELRRDAEGRCSVVVRSGSEPDASGVVCRWDSSSEWVQIHTADRPVAAESRLGLAVEPMTCAPNAFNSGEGLVRLAPGETHGAGWLIAAL